MTRHVAVIGAGIVGAFTALELLREGHRVTVIEPGEPGGEQAASYGNGAWISPGSIMPVSTPGLWRQVPGMLADPLGPFAIRWQHLPRLAPWLIRFVAAGATQEKVVRVARARHQLLLAGGERYRAVAAEAGLGELVVSRGLLYVYPDRAAFEAEGGTWRLRQELGVRWQTIDRDELPQLEPGLNRGYRFGVLVEDGAHLVDPGAFVAGLVAHAAANGASLMRGRAVGFDILDGRLSAVRLEGGGSIACDAAVLCAGAWAAQLAREAGDAVPLESERGYHVVLDNPAYVPNRPIMPSDGKMAVTMTSAGLRAAGQVELASLTAPPDWRRADILLEYIGRLFPANARAGRSAGLRRWMGHRPSTPDGLPSLGRSRRCPDVFHNFGHGHTGIAMAPASARQIAALVSGRAPTVDAAPYAPQRFGGA